MGFFSLGHIELLIILVLAVLFFTVPSKVPGMVRNIRQGMGEYQKITGEIKEAFSLGNLFNDDNNKK